MRDTGLDHVGVGAAEVFHRDVLAGDGLDDVGAGDEHLAGLVDHDDEVGQRGGVDVTAGGGAHDQRDLRDDAGGRTLRWKISPYRPSETTPSWMRAPAPSLMPTSGRPVLDREVHDLDDLLAVDLTEAATEDGGVLGEDADVAAVDGAVAGDDTVADGAVRRPDRSWCCGGGPERRVRRTNLRRADAVMRSRAVSLPLACTFSTGGLTDGCLSLGLTIAQVGELSGGGVDIGRTRRLGRGGLLDSGHGQSA